MKRLLALTSAFALSLSAMASTQTPNTYSQSIYIQTDGNGKHPVTKIEAYENGKKLDHKEAEALYHKMQQNEVQLQRDMTQQMNWLNHYPTIVMPHIGEFYQPINLQTVKDALIRYHDSGRYTAAIASVAHEAAMYLKARVQENNKLKHPKKLAVVFDIDETLLSNYNNMKALGFGGNLHLFIQNEEKANGTPIKPTRDLYNLAKKEGVTIFLVTGRKPFERSATYKNLKDAGFSGWKKIYFKPADYKQHSAAPYKTASRRDIMDHGYDIIFTMGDQLSDLQGGYADMGFKLPNPFYRIP